jgi:DNA polymerase-3 subunit epsilon
MLPCYVLLDLETTGGSPVHDRITEIAAVRIEDGQEVARWSTLVNPGVPISSFIENLTGISDELVADAPAFADVAPRLLEIITGAVLVAHNVRFDHGFLVNEFARQATSLHLKTLCTVRLSRLLYPQYKSHGLDAIMQRHGLSSSARHRAMGDVEVMLAWLAQATQELGADLIRQHAQALLQTSASLPPQLETPVGEIPESAGVYVMYGDAAQALFVGKSSKLRSRVLSHFQTTSKDPDDLRLAKETRRIEWIETAGELGTLLLEARLLKEKQPLYNRQLRRDRTLCAWRLSTDPKARPLLSLVRGEDLNPREFGQLYGLYRSKNQAIKSLRELADSQQLCLKMLGLESGKGACAAHASGHCRGVCCGAEAPELHHLRLQQALALQRLHVWPYPGKVGVREHNPQTDRTDLHVFDQWCHLATLHDEGELADVLASRREPAFDLDTYRLLLKHLQPAGRPLIQFGAESLSDS